ncbi:hypothetical protein BMG00_12640 [Thioclava marina]|uniref:DUF2946 domain-containing protein n=1 Tax=Thioclava marina TaxID=1915077 RepID=A0ABX3ML51_9RHOB|nr:DUF2946 family protein [Thioclava marina]OOY11918.1 hypothetical protein BMG00_12640 [Thioclava marina]
MNVIGVKTIGGRLARLLLLLAVLLAGLVPDGMMRQASADGMRLVLCTADGVQEVWLTDDGKTTPVDPGHEQTETHEQHCVQVNLIAHAFSLPDIEPRNIAITPVVLAGISHQVLSRQVVDDARRSRAPPAFM